MISFIEYLSVPEKVGLAIVACLLVMNLVGEFLEFKGKVVPEWVKLRKFFTRRKREKAEAAQTLKDVQVLLNDVNGHYSADNIAKRDGWMQWVNNRAEVYDASIKQLREEFAEVMQALKDNTKMTEEMFVQSSRDRIIDFSYRAADYSIPVSREEFNRIFKVYNKYEKFLEDHKMTNGEIDIVYGIIKKSYEHRMENHTFIEDIHGL